MQHHFMQVMDEVHAFLLVQNALTQAYADGVDIGGQTQSLLHYNVTLKSHYFWHLAHQSQWHNPKVGLMHAHTSMPAKGTNSAL